jgi:AAA+ superfamily predicted ATPase
MNFLSSPENIAAISGELNWLTLRIQSILENRSGTFLPLPPPGNKSAYAALVNEHGITDTDRVLLDLSLAASFAPEILAPLAQAAMDKSWALHTGGFFRQGDAQFYPTVRTAVFLLSGTDIETRSYYSSYFHNKRRVFTSNLVLTVPRYENTTFLNHEVIFNDQFLGSVLHGEEPRLDGEHGFPTRRSKRRHSLAEVVLAEKTKEEIGKLRRFTRHMKKLWELNQNNRYRNNFISIFSGEPGTGKSHTAEAIGNEFGLPVYKVNFAQMVSKYIGETEKNLEKIFDRFDRQPCILFFDEAESVFSKRTEVSDSHDQHANNTQSYLLQKIEEFSGIVVLATNVQNLLQHFDKAFQRRIRLIAHFSFPDYPERQKLWNQALEPPFKFAGDLTERLAKNYQFTGGSIYNIVSDAVLAAMDKETETITFELIEPALADEFKKTGRKYEICTDEMVHQNPIRRFGTGYESRKNF